MSAVELSSVHVVPPRPQAPPVELPPWRLIAAMRTNVLGAWPQKAYRDEVVQRRFFGRTSHIFNAPAAIRHVLVDNHEAYERTPATIRILRPMLGEGLLLSTGQAWRHQRRTLSPAFTPKAVNLIVPHILSATDEAIAELAAAGGRPLDLMAALQKLTLEIAGRTMFSLEMGRHGPALRGFVMRYGRSLARPHFLDIVLPLGWPSPQDVARAWFRRNWTRFVETLMAERGRSAAPAGAPRDLFDLLVAARDPETGEAFSPAQLRDQVATMMLAGHETTAVALFWALYLLALAPDVQERAAGEALATWEGAGEPSAEQLIFIRAVLDEAMRLYPPAYVIVRAASRPDTIGDIRIAHGDVIVISPWILHRHHRLWREPDAFMPERFLPSAAAIDRFAYLPFGVGPRVCVGAHFALTEATLALASLLRAFRVEIAGARPVLPVAVVTTQPDHPAAFRLTRR